MDVVNRPVGELIPYEKNAKKHDRRQIANVAESIRQYGFVQPVVIDRDGVIVIGHCRVLAAKKLGMTEVPCVSVEDLTPEQVNALRIVDNKTNESPWDLGMLSVELPELDLSGFEFDFELPKKVEFLAGTGDVVEDDVPDAQETYVCRTGDIWQLGRHRLMCGDSTDEYAVSMLMCGAKADMVMTDPPYNLASNSKNYGATVSKNLEKLSESQWDKNFDILPALDNIKSNIAKNSTVYICTSHFLAPVIWSWMSEWSDYYSYCIWSKPNPMPSLSKRHWTHNTEIICYATQGKHVFNFPEAGHALSVWEIPKTNGKTGHPTEKPVRVPSMAIEHSSGEGEIVLDLFGGSGTTMIACEQLGRTCYMMELDPKYCDVIIRRWENFTGGKAVKLN